MGETEGYLPFPRDFETICAHCSNNVDTRSPCNEMAIPIVTSNFHDTRDCCALSRYVPNRVANTTRSYLENLLAILNKAKYGLCFASGIGAIAAVFALMKTGDHIICSDDIYGGTTHFLLGLKKKFCIESSFVDMCCIKNLENAIKPETKLIWTENPTNPKLKVLDLCHIAEIAREKCILTVTDNTFLTPFLQRPLEFGIDVVVHSVSKYINGHSDVIMGSVCTNRDDIYEKLKYIQTNLGHVPSPFDCSQVIRGLKTLPHRMKTHQQNALKVAEHLLNYSEIEDLRHPGLPCHPQYELFKSQTSGHSAVISFYLKGNFNKSIQFMNNLKIFTQGLSLGGYESLVELPSLCSHRDVPEEIKQTLGITDNLIRMSVGLEDVCDLIEDIDQSLEQLRRTI